LLFVVDIVDVAVVVVVVVEFVVFDVVVKIHFCYFLNSMFFLRVTPYFVCNIAMLVVRRFLLRYLSIILLTSTVSL